MIVPTPTVTPSNRSKATHLLEIGRREIVGQRKLGRLRGGVGRERAEAATPVVILRIAHRTRLERGVETVFYEFVLVTRLAPTISGLLDAAAAAQSIRNRRISEMKQTQLRHAAVLMCTVHCIVYKCSMRGVRNKLIFDGSRHQQVHSCKKQRLEAA